MAIPTADAMAFAVDCADHAELHTGDVDAATFADPGRFGSLISFFGLCPTDWPATPGEFTAPVESAIPALVLAGSLRPGDAAGRFETGRRHTGDRDVRRSRTGRPRRHHIRPVYHRHRARLPRRPAHPTRHDMRGRVRSAELPLITARLPIRLDHRGRRRRKVATRPRRTAAASTEQRHHVAPSRGHPGESPIRQPWVSTVTKTNGAPVRSLSTPLPAATSIDGPR